MFLQCCVLVQMRCVFFAILGVLQFVLHLNLCTVTACILFVIVLRICLKPLRREAQFLQIGKCIFPERKDFCFVQNNLSPHGT